MGLVMTTSMSLLRSMPLAFVLCLTGISPQALAATAPAAAAPAAAYAVDLRAYLDSIHWYERALADRPHLDDPYNREFFAAFSASMTPDRFYAQALPVFERYIPPAEARTLGAMARKRPVPAADQQAALAAFAKVDLLAGAALAKIWDGLIDDFSNTAIERSVAELRRSIADMAAHDEPGYVPRVNKVGLSYLDRINALTITLYATQWQASKAKETRCAGTNP
jgi:hypothetical protein